ncbi:MAG: PD-(D/E)XK nuclease family protein [Muribaculaceae bacterium]|nr:PD-(D/E)XK nuclease family protein [Muribaculaceae bacterium]
MSKPVTFLESVVDYLLSDTSDHRRTLILVPNKRSAIFMKRYFKRQAKTSVFMPDMKTLGSFMWSLTGLEEASAAEQLFTLYDAYCEVSDSINGTHQDFDRFRFWGEIMLEDFEDLDLQLANPVDVFTNVKRLEEIQTDFLNEDQRQVAKELWGYEPASFEGFRSNRHAKDSDDIIFDEFCRLTELLLPIYELFNSKLQESGLSRRGLTARNAVNILEREDSARVSLLQNYDRFAIVGFSTLKRSEREIFKLLKNQGLAEFFWDIPDMLSRDLPPEFQDYRSPLTRYIEKLTGFFPMPPHYNRPSAATSPNIEIISVPANAYQAKVAGNILYDLENNIGANFKRADSTAVVLPDTALLMPLLHSVTVDAVNVTMGVPLRHTPFATLFSLVIRMNMSARTDYQGEVVFLTQNVMQILSHSSLVVPAQKDTALLREYIEKENRYFVSARGLQKQSPALAFLFEPLESTASALKAKQSVLNIIEGLKHLLESYMLSHPSASADQTSLHEFKVMDAIGVAVDKLVDIIERHSQYICLEEMKRLSFIRLIEKELFHIKLNMFGSPLSGVQIMGVLETRSLDFENVVMLSMNEKTFPPRNIIRTLIPASVRAGFGLTMAEEKELQYAWIYANLVSRCKNAYILYNSAAEARGQGGMSRYLFQTLYIYNKPNPRLINILPEGALTHPNEILVLKTDKVLQELSEFKAGGSRNLSVSALEQYGQCPLRFYLSTVRRVAEAQKPEDSIDDATQGTVVHNVLQKIFENVKLLNDNRMDSSFEISLTAISQMVANEFSACRYGGSFRHAAELPHEAWMHVQYYSAQISKIIELERQRPPYTVECCEMSPRRFTKEKDWFNLPVTPDLSVRFKFKIDRVDRLDDNTLRFVDYKTGRDPISAENFDSLFWDKSENDQYPETNKALFQLLTYAFAYNELMASLGKPEEKNIRLEITKVTDPEESVAHNPFIGDIELIYHDDEVVKAFPDRLRALISDIFNPDVPFAQTENPDNCCFCQFKNICGRDAEIIN